MNEETAKKCPIGQYYCFTDKKCKPLPRGYHLGSRGMLEKDTENKNGNGNGNSNGGNGNGNGNGNGAESGGNDAGMGEEVVYEGGSLRQWFKGSKSKDGKPGWVQSDGSPCANEPGEKGTPKCYSSAKKSSMSKKELRSADTRKSRQDPNQQSKSGASKPTYVATDKPKKKIKSIKEMVDFVTLPLEIEIPNDIRDFNLGLMFRESLSVNSGMYFIFEEVGQKSFYMKETKIPLDIAFITEDGTIDSIKELEPYNETPVESEGEVLYALEVNRGWFAENNVEVGDEINVEISEGSDKKGKGSGTKDACYHKVKSRYSVWPSAYASGALVKCRKKGAANWGNSTKKEETELGEACWKGYEKKGMKTMFGKRYPNCVKKKTTRKEEIEVDEAVKGQDSEMRKAAAAERKSGDKRLAPSKGKGYADQQKQSINYMDKKTKIDEAIRLPAKSGNIVDTYFYYRGRYFSLKMFFPQISMPKKSDVQDQIEKVYPGAKLKNYRISDYEPGQPILHAEGAAWTKESGKNKEGGLNEKGRKSYEKENPGSDLKAPSKKVGNPRRASFCARMKGMKKKLTSAKTARDPDSRINKSLRKWNC